jgi:hypothetical protein
MSEYKMLEGINRSLGRLEGKVDSLISSNNQAIDRMNRIDADIHSLERKAEKGRELHEGRLDSLEKKQYGLLLGATALWSLIGFLIRKYI